VVLSRWLNRLWLGLIAVSFVFLALVWVAVMTERLGWRVFGALLAGALVTRYWSTRTPTAPHS
jgi:hypothetical protein